MTLDRNSTLSKVAAEVSSALARAGIRGVLTGGACANLYTRGAYQSSDLDFVLQGSPSQSQLDAAMASIGFKRSRDTFTHASTEFFVEFPRGPLAIGSDLQIEPVEFRIHRKSVLTLSPTDSCRDRLAAWYFWRDRQSLRTAVQIAVANEVDVARIAAWSRREGYVDDFKQFKAEVAGAKAAKMKPTSR